MSLFFQKLKQNYQVGNIVQKLISWNVGIGVLTLILSAFFPAFYKDQVIHYLALRSSFDFALKHIWSFLTYSFLHAGIFHLLFNMLMLFFVGRLFKTFFTEHQLLGVYINGAVFSGIIYVLAYQLMPESGVVVGASGAVMALLFAVVSYQPTMRVRLLLVGQVQLWHIAAVFVFLDLVQIPISNAGGHIAHLGGALYGFIYIKLLYQNIDLSHWVTGIQNLFKRKPLKRKPAFRNVYKNANQSEKVYASSLDKNETQKRIDRILDKIKKTGYDSLSAEEKEFLFRQQ